MNRNLILASVAMVAAGCVNDSPLYVTGFASADPTNTGACTLEPGSVSQVSGSLDLSGTANYVLIASLKSELSETLDTKADTVTLVTGQQRNTVILDTVAFTYTSLPTATIPSVTYQAESAPIAIVVRPGGTSNIRMGLLGPIALEAIAKAIPAGSTDTTIVRSSIVFQGSINSGGRIKSTPISFPITVFRSGKACPTGEFFCPTGACGNIGGQDGSPLVCSSGGTCAAKK